ncbi:esterase/lipase family protein [Nocardia brasiliensis]|uniref:esterase/lipase family protein n=1 Tax=Nocardia brasiliensis TaxID=37326 RepID=UPI0002DC883F|nr:alpha/beta fold hydrolase [Nocardia brasiliensis]OCF88583.1 lipase [Nocardia brasiliensis]
MRSVPRSLVIIAVLVALWVTATGSALARQDPIQQYPVEYNSFPGVPYELANPGGSLPGSNNWSCRPSAEHPNPVVLVHGYALNAQSNWGVYVPLLANEGYCVYALTYGAYKDMPWPFSSTGGLRSVEESGADIAAFVDRVLEATGAARVDIVSHSAGAIVSNYYAKRLGGAVKVDKIVSLAPFWLGTNWLGWADIAAFVQAMGAGAARDALMDATCKQCNQLYRNADFLRELNSDGVYSPAITYTNIATEHDQLAVPYTSGLVPATNATNIVVQQGCSQDYSGHGMLASTRRVAAYVLNALDPANTRAVPCEFIPVPL